MKKNNQLIPENILNIQRFLIAWFLSDWHSEDYKWVIKSKMFWIYQDVFEYLIENGNNFTPDLLKVISWEEFTTVMWFYSSDFVTNRDKYILELFDWYVKTSFEDWNDIFSRLNDIKKIRDRLEEIRTGNISKDYSITNLLIEAENLSLIMKDKEGILGYKTWLPTLDKYTEWLQKWTVMRLNAYSNIGKSKLSYFICNNLLKQNASIIYFSLEVTKVRVAYNLLAHWYWKDYNTIAKAREMIDYSSYANNKIEVIDDMYDINEIVRYTELRKPDVIFIDFIQNIKGHWNSEYERLSNIAIDIQQLAIKNNIAIFDLSQISNEWMNYQTGGMIPSKWSWSLVASADVWLMLYKKWDQLYLDIAKNKFWQNAVTIQLKSNFSIWDFEDLWLII